MNFKERLNLTKNNNPYEYTEIERRNETSSFDIFSRNSDVEKILRNTFIKDKNVIIATKKDCNKEIIFSYIKNITYCIF